MALTVQDVLDIDIEELVWDEWNIGHIARHDVVPTEVEEVCRGAKIANRTYGDRISLIGPTSIGRLLYLVLVPRGGNTYYPLTARVADKKERTVYIEEKGDVVYERGNKETNTEV